VVQFVIILIKFYVCVYALSNSCIQLIFLQCFDTVCSVTDWKVTCWTVKIISHHQYQKVLLWAARTNVQCSMKFLPCP